MNLWTAFAIFAQITIISLHVQAKTVSIPLKGVLKIGTDTVEGLNAHLQSIKTAKATRGVLRMTNYQNLYFYGPITVGGKTFQVLFDTGSTDLFVPSGALCPPKTTSAYCQKHAVYQNTKTRVQGKTYSQIYGIGAVSGYVASDIVNVAGIEVKGQEFGVATSIDESTKAQEYDGILGLALPKLSAFGGVPVFINMINQKQVSQPVFAFYLSRTVANGGELTLGGINANHVANKEQWTFANIVSAQDYEIQVASISLDFKPKAIVYTSKAGVTGTVDSGSSLHYCDSDIVNKINAAIGAVADGEVYTVDCAKVKSLPNCNYVINGKAFVLTPNDYILQSKKNNKQVCTSIFVPTDDRSCVIGVPFMRKYYTQFDLKTNRVGFVLAK